MSPAPSPWWPTPGYRSTTAASICSPGLIPARRPSSADAVKKFANLLMDIGAAATSGAQNSEPEQAARLKDVDATNATITELCK